MALFGPLSTPTLVRPLQCSIDHRPEGSRMIRRHTVRAGYQGPASLAMLALASLALASCAVSPPRDAAAIDAHAAPIATLHRDDVLWLERTSFGLNSGSVADYRRLGRERFLEQQLSARDDALPAPIAAQIAALDISHQDVVKTLADVRAQRRSINAIDDPTAKQQARKALDEQGNVLTYQAVRRELLRAVYSSAQLQEEMVWFWLNHFSVHQYKGDLRWLVADYEEHAIRPYALGRFRDLVLSTLEHPAMLEYLDNAQNAAGHVNENYARELMELHTLGVDAGYTQRDVQELARVLTGAGVNVGPQPHLRPEWQRLYVRRGAFEFNPARHDFGPKVLLGHTIPGGGFTEIESAVTLIVRQPACARFISRELATYFVADDPPPRLIEAMAQTFERSDGDIAAVLRTMFESKEFEAALGTKFKDPVRYVVSAVRFAYDSQTINNTRPLLNWLNALGEAPFGRQTPDGYPLTEPSWTSPGQISRRFEIARAIGSGNGHVFDTEEGGVPASSGFPQPSNRLYFEAFEPFLATSTRSALNRAASPQEWGTFLLASPEFNYE
jgi:uncharacterized protein (DUF1800 family)